MYGIDPFQAVIIAIRFIDQLMVANRPDFDVLEINGEPYMVHSAGKKELGEKVRQKKARSYLKIKLASSNMKCN